MAAKRIWLMKSEPNTYSYDDLVRDKSTLWDGVRNYQARNLMRDEIKKGDEVLFYHSNANPPGVAGLAVIAREAYPDPTQFNPKSKYFDSKSTAQNPRWVVVDLKPKKRLKQFVSLPQLRDNPRLDGMVLLRRGSRLSVQPVTPAEFREILSMGGVPPR